MKEKLPISRRQICMLTCATQDENYYVAQILVDLPNIILTRESSFALKWGCKKRRSRVNNDVERPPQPKAATDSAGAGASPVTPLAFSPSESDRRRRRRRNSKHRFKRSSSHKRSKEKYAAMLQELTHRRDLLRQEIGNVTNYYNKLIAYNSQLKAMKQEVLNSCQIKQESISSRCGGGNVGISLGQPQPLVSDQMADVSVGPYPAQLESPYNGLVSIGIPDLNISAEETIQRDLLADRRSRFAEARRRRMDIMKIKITKSACGGIKFPRARSR